MRIMGHMLEDVGHLAEVMGEEIVHYNHQTANDHAGEDDASQLMPGPKRPLPSLLQRVPGKKPTFQNAKLDQKTYHSPAMNPLTGGGVG